MLPAVSVIGVGCREGEKRSDIEMRLHIKSQSYINFATTYIVFPSYVRHFSMRRGTSFDLFPIVVPRITCFIEVSF